MNEWIQFLSDRVKSFHVLDFENFKVNPSPLAIAKRAMYKSYCKELNKQCGKHNINTHELF